jgi:hypothetical protein
MIRIFLSVGMLLFSGACFSHEADIGAACDANFAAKQSIGHGRSMSFTTWVTIPEAGTEKVVEKLKAAGSQAGFYLANETRSGPKAYLFFKSLDGGKAVASSDRQNGSVAFPLNIQVDQAMHTVSIVAPNRDPQYANRADDIRKMMCGLLISATGVDEHTGSKYISKESSVHLENPFSKIFRKSETKAAAKKEDLNFSAIDAMFARAFAAGKSIVVIPTISPTASYPIDGKYDVFQSEMTSTTVWQGPDKGFGTELHTGPMQDAARVGLQGRLWDFYTKTLIYQIYIVDPGVYSISGSSAELLGGEMPTGNVDAKVPPGVGQVELQSLTFGEVGVGTVHHDPIYESRNVQSCAAAMVGSGQCVEYQTQTVQKLVNAGGDLPRTWAKVPGLNISVSISEKFASFEVPVGKAILVDGFFGGVPNTAFDAGSCRPLDGSIGGRSTGRVRCEMLRYTLVRVHANRDELLEKAAFYAERLPALTRILSTITVQPVDVQAEEGDTVPGSGREYFLRAH